MFEDESTHTFTYFLCEDSIEVVILTIQRAFAQNTYVFCLK